MSSCSLSISSLRIAIEKIDETRPMIITTSLDSKLYRTEETKSIEASKPSTD